jgi:hypothetical protein
MCILVIVDNTGEFIYKFNALAKRVSTIYEMNYGCKWKSTPEAD